MKKTLAAVAILGAFAGSAMADVTVYGKVDMGMAVVNSGDTTTMKMATGQSSGNRYGLKGSEKIADGLTVGFQLEAGFSADTGANAGTATFHRESRLWVATDYGTLHFGRMGTLDSGTGSVNLGGSMSAFGTGWGADDLIGDARHVIKLDTRRDNVVTYQSPKMGGLTVYAQVASGTEADAVTAGKHDENGNWVAESKVAADRAGAEYGHDADRYWAVGAKYQAGAFDAAFTASKLDASNAGTAEDRDNYNAYVGYNFGVAKAMVQVGYMEQGDADQWGVVLSATAPVATGKVLAMAGYGVETSATNVDTDKFNVAVAYQHTLSKQTYLYAGLGYAEKEVDGGAKTDATVGQFGICHNF